MTNYLRGTGLTATALLHILLALAFLTRPHVTMKPQPPAILLVKIAETPRPPKPTAAVKLPNVSVPVPQIALPQIATASPITVRAEPAPAIQAETPPAPVAVAQPQDYPSQIMAHLTRLKRYPAEARRRGQQGVATLFCRIDGAGHVLEFAITQGSGSVILDDEVKQLVRRAEPFPAPPDGKALEMTIPVEFVLNR
jgi:protein TonB